MLLRMDAAGEARRGAYGLAVEGLDGDGGWLTAAPPGWPTLAVEVAPAGADAAAGWLADDAARIAFGSGGGVVLRRDPLRARFDAAAGVDFVHPYLTPVAAVASVWLGRHAFHGGAVAVDGGAWGVFAGRRGGKSSLLALLASLGAQVLSDDLLATDGRVVFAGPRSVDLREDAAAALGAGEPLGAVGLRDRWRLRLGAVPAEVPLRGCVHLAWDGAVRVEPVPPRERPRLLAAQPATSAAGDAYPRVLLELAALPALALRRPRRWESAREGAERLLDVLSSTRAGRG